MKRRHFIYLSSATVAATLAPPAFAVNSTVDFSLPIFDEIERVERALDFVKQHFPTREQAAVLGLTMIGHVLSAEEQRDTVFRVLFYYNDRYGAITTMFDETADRIRLINEIKGMLDKRFGTSVGNLCEQIAWMRSTNEVFPSFTLSGHMKTTSVSWMKYAAHLLRKTVAIA